MEYVKQAMGDALVIYCGSPAYDESIVVLTSKDLDVIDVRNYYLPGNILLQKVPIGVLLGADSLIIDLNPRVPHVWLLLLMRRMLGRRTLLWGHAFPRAGRGATTDRLRGLMRSLADGLLTYTRQQAVELAEIHRDKQIFTAPNALYYRSEISFDESQERGNIIYVGRLDPSKKVLDLMNAFERAAPALCSHGRLIIVGDGVEMDAVRALRDGSPFRDRIDIMGHVGDYERLRELYSRAFMSASPGCVGLSIMQSFAFGVPMLISPNELHGPEIEAARDGENCRFFETGNTQSHADLIVEFWNEREAWREKGSLIAAECADNYSVEAMGDGIIKALTSERPA